MLDTHFSRVKCRLRKVGVTEFVMVVACGCPISLSMLEQLHITVASLRANFLTVLALMDTQLIYAFDSAQVANRFLNTLKNWSVADVNARFYNGNSQVKVTYQYVTGGFDRTSAELDDLAARMGGREVTF